MEDIGSGIDPAQALLGEDPRKAEQLMLALAAALGRMHAATAGHKAGYDQLRAELGPVSAWEADHARKLISGWVASLENLGVSITWQPTGLNRVLSALVDQGFPALPRRSCPDNWRDIRGNMRLFDFNRGFRRLCRWCVWADSPHLLVASNSLEIPLHWNDLPPRR
jgi:hypothetical protein